MEHLDYLWQGGACFYYDDALFKPSTDSFVLSSFARPRKGDRVCDLGCGTGLLGLLLSLRQEDLFIENVEIQPSSLALAEKTFAANRLSERASFRLGDLREASVLPAAGSCDYVISNPPYFRAGSGFDAPDAHRSAARQDHSCRIDELCAAARRVLRWGGTMGIVFRAERTTDLLCAMRDAGIEPKRLRFVQDSPAAAPSLLLVEGKRGAKPGLIVQAPLFLHTADGCESAESREIYFRERQ